MRHLLLEVSRKKSANQRKTRILAYFKQFEKTYPFHDLILYETNL